MNSKELYALKNSALHKNPIRLTTASKILSRVRRFLGDDVYQSMIEAITEARSTNDPSVWFSAISDLISKQETKEKEEEKQKKLEQKKADAVLPKKIGLNVVIAAKPTINKVTPLTVIRRRASDTTQKSLYFSSALRPNQR